MIDLATRKQDFRNAMAAVPAPVHIITTDGPAGKAGITATAFTAITDDPPTVLVCLNRQSYAARVVLENQRLAVNTLPDGMNDSAGRFAGVGKLDMQARFLTQEGWTILASGAPVLPAALSVFDCDVASVQEMGTHYLIFCHVLQAISRPSEADAQGMIYHQRSYKRTAAAQQVQAA